METVKVEKSKECYNCVNYNVRERICLKLNKAVNLQFSCLFYKTKKK